MNEYLFGADHVLLDRLESLRLKFLCRDRLPR